MVGSSNFTKPGLTQNVELNVQVQSPSEVAQLQTWYEEHWEKSEDISEDILRIIRRGSETWFPFDIYSQSLRELFRDREESPNVWQKMSPLCSQYWISIKKRPTGRL